MNSVSGKYRICVEAQLKIHIKINFIVQKVKKPIVKGYVIDGGWEIEKCAFFYLIMRRDR